MKENGLPWSTFSDRDQAAEIHGGLVAYWTDDAPSRARFGTTVEEAAKALAEALGPPRRQVLEESEGVFRVEGSDFITTDRVLAEAVAAEYDQLDPLPERFSDD